MRLLVLGGTVFLGRHVVEGALAQAEGSPGRNVVGAALARAGIPPERERRLLDAWRREAA